MIGIDAIADAVGSLFGIVDKAVEDKDKKNELKAKVVELQVNVSLAMIEAEKARQQLEAEVTKSALSADLPAWAKVTYLFFRQIYSIVVVAIVVGMQMYGTPLDANTIMLMIAPGTAYSLVKGKGNSL